MSARDSRLKRLFGNIKDLFSEEPEEVTEPKTAHELSEAEQNLIDMIRQQAEAEEKVKSGSVEPVIDPVTDTLEYPDAAAGNPEDTGKAAAAAAQSKAAAPESADPKASKTEKKTPASGKSSVQKRDTKKKGDTGVDFKDPKYYTNRELSWLQFDRRVLNEAKDDSIPILDRLKFASITSSNLDEFFMVRVASLKDQLHADVRKRDIAGMTPKEQLDAINTSTRHLVDVQYKTVNESLLPLLKEKGIEIVPRWEDLTEEQSEYVDGYFMDEVYPVLTPMAVDASRPFPLIRNKSLNIAALIRRNDEESKILEAGLNAENINEEEKTLRKYAVDFATVQVPSGLPRFVEIPGSEENRYTFVLLEQIIEKNLNRLFLSYDVICAYPYRVMRNADFSIDEDETEDLLKELQTKLKTRQRGDVIRLEVESGVDDTLLHTLEKYLDVEKEDVFQIPGAIDLTFLMKMYGLEGCDDLREESFRPQPNPRIHPDDNIFDDIRQHDIFLTHPYETFDPVVDLIRQGAKDPNVLAIKMTLYRVSSQSPIIAALERAAENGKQVTVLVELKARFDEENNIVWAKRLEKAGCHVIYGLLGLKTHSKIALVVRREEDGIRRYVHLGTGNYNDSTAKLYTDCGILTCSEPIGEDATAVFNMLSGYSEPPAWNRLVVAPIWLRKKTLSWIRRETKNAQEGREAVIVAKMNSLCDRQLIAALYEASNAGVKVYLIVRGICCLQTGIPGISENIHVISVVGTFLEHSRIFYFYNNGAEEIYMGSADWMPRNMDRRVEIVFPVEDPELKERAKHILEVMLSDNKKAYYVNDKNKYVRFEKGEVPPTPFTPLEKGEVLGAQDTFMKEAREANSSPEKKWAGRTFTPVFAQDEV